MEVSQITEDEKLIQDCSHFSVQIHPENLEQLKNTMLYLSLVQNFCRNLDNKPKDIVLRFFTPQIIQSLESLSFSADELVSYVATKVYFTFCLSYHLVEIFSSTKYYQLSLEFICNQSFSEKLQGKMHTQNRLNLFGCIKKILKEGFKASTTEIYSIESKKIIKALDQYFSFLVDLFKQENFLFSHELLSILIVAVKTIDKFDFENNEFQTFGNNILSFTFEGGFIASIFVQSHPLLLKKALKLIDTQLLKVNSIERMIALPIKDCIFILLLKLSKLRLPTTTRTIFNTIMRPPENFFLVCSVAFPSFFGQFDHFTIKKLFAIFEMSDVLFDTLFSIFEEQDSLLIHFSLSLLKTYLHEKEMNDELKYLVYLLSPHKFFLRFLENISFDHSVLIDFLISNETNFLSYFLMYLKFISTHWNEFCESTKSLVLSKRETNHIENNHLEKLEVDDEYILEMICDCILRTLYAVRKLKEKNIFPYNIEPLIKRMTEIECLYELRESKNQIAQDLSDSLEEGEEWSGSDYEDVIEQFDTQFIGKINEKIRSNLKENELVVEDDSEIVLHIAGWHI